MYQSFRFNRFFLILLFLVSVTSVSCQYPAPTAVATSTPRNYSVRVVDAVTQRPIVNAAVTISKSGMPLNARTDSIGVAAFDTIKEDDIEKLGQIIVEATGYERYALFVEVSPDSLSTEIPLTPLPTATPTFTTEPLSCEEEVSILAAQTIVAPRETVTLIANANGRSLEYEWAADRGVFNQTNVQIVEYTAPGEPGAVLITVKAKDPNCVEPKTAAVEFKVIESISAAIQATVTITNEAILNGTSIDTVILTPGATVTTTKTLTATEEINVTRTQSALEVLPVVTTPSTPTPNISVTLLGAENRGDSINLTWTYEGDLEPDMYFAVRVGPHEDVHSRFWSNVPPFEYGLSIGPGTEFGEGEYEWYVVVVRDLVPDGSGADGQWYEIKRSNIGTFHVPFIPTPNPSVPPPLP